MSIASRAREQARNARVEHVESLRKRFPLRDGSGQTCYSPNDDDLQALGRIKRMQSGKMIRDYAKNTPCRAAKGAARQSAPHFFKRIKRALGLEKA